MGYDTFHKFPLIDTYAFFNYCKQSCSEQETPFYTYSVRVLAFPSDGYLKLAAKWTSLDKMPKKGNLLSKTKR